MDEGILDEGTLGQLWHIYHTIIFTMSFLKSVRRQGEEEDPEGTISLNVLVTIAFAAGKFILLNIKIIKIINEPPYCLLKIDTIQENS